MYHFEGGWPKDINPRDEEITTRYRRRIEKDDNWAPKLRPLFEVCCRSNTHPVTELRFVTIARVKINILASVVRNRRNLSARLSPVNRKFSRQMMEHHVLQNGTVNIYEHYFDDMIPTPLVQPFGFR